VSLFPFSPVRIFPLTSCLISTRPVWYLPPPCTFESASPLPTNYRFLALLRFIFQLDLPPSFKRPSLITSVFLFHLLPNPPSLRSGALIILFCCPFPLLCPPLISDEKPLSSPFSSVHPFLSPPPPPPFMLDCHGINFFLRLL